MAYPPAPWQLHGDMWLSLFRVPAAGGRPGGLYGAAWVVYREPSPLTYHELLVARLRRDQPGRRVTVTDIWVDSVDSLEGGRALWAIPKEMADFGMEAASSGPLRRTSWHAALGDRPIATARFTDAAAVAPPVPFRYEVQQERADRSGVLSPVVSPVAGRGRVLPARASWDFAPDGPLGFLAGHRTLASFTLSTFRLSFG